MAQTPGPRAGTGRQYLASGSLTSCTLGIAVGGQSEQPDLPGGPALLRDRAAVADESVELRQEVVRPTDHRGAPLVGERRCPRLGADQGLDEEDRPPVLSGQASLHPG